MRQRRIDGWLTAVVLAHLLVTFVHGAAHSGAAIGLSRAGMLFVLLVIEIAPIAGLALAITGRRSGAWLVAASMAGALLFGLVNHFVIVSPDHVSQVAGQYRSLFTSSAVLLLVTEAAGVAAGLRAAMRPVEEWS